MKNKTLARIRVGDWIKIYIRHTENTKLVPFYGSVRNSHTSLATENEHDYMHLGAMHSNENDIFLVLF